MKILPNFKKYCLKTCGYDDVDCFKEICIEEYDKEKEKIFEKMKCCENCKNSIKEWAQQSIEDICGNCNCYSHWELNI